jgi:outer membrane biosynthesis protein TonB
MYITRLQSWALWLTFGLVMIVSATNANAQRNEDVKPSIGNAENLSEVFYDIDPKSWARVLKIFPPTYPSDALTNGVIGFVDLEVLLDIAGKVKEVRSITSTPNNPAFEQVTRDVLRYWEFGVPRTNRCVPYEIVGEARLTFEIRNGEGIVSLTHRQPAKFANLITGIEPKLLNLLEVARAGQASYPRDARRAGAEAVVDALVTVSSETGELLEIEVTSVITTKGPTKLFHDAAKTALSKSRYPPFESRTSTWKKCTRISYQLSK